MGMSFKYRHQIMLHVALLKSISDMFIYTGLIESAAAFVASDSIKIRNFKKAKAIFHAHGHSK